MNFAASLSIEQLTFEAENSRYAIDYEESSFDKLVNGDSDFPVGDSSSDKIKVNSATFVAEPLVSIRSG